MIIPPHKLDQLVRPDRLGEQSFLSWIDQVTEAINFMQPLDGGGSPEGVVKAAKHKLYFDVSGSPGSFYYRKTTDENLDTGWVAIG